MKKIGVFILLTVILCAGCQKKIVYKATLVELMAKGCPACEKMRPDIEALKIEYAGLVNFRIYDVTTEEGSEKAGIYKLNGTPTLVFLDENGMEYFRLEKTIQKDVIEALLNTKTGNPHVR
jgi:thiol-disulfide isomerase/thioredoxin